jgi:hypothetical protein
MLRNTIPEFIAHDGSIFNLTWNKARVAFKEYGSCSSRPIGSYVAREDQGIKQEHICRHLSCRPSGLPFSAWRWQDSSASQADK